MIPKQLNIVTMTCMFDLNEHSLKSVGSEISVFVGGVPRVGDAVIIGGHKFKVVSVTWVTGHNPRIQVVVPALWTRKAVEQYWTDAIRDQEKLDRSRESDLHPPQ
jgi:hypothetical protein